MLLLLLLKVLELELEKLPPLLQLLNSRLLAHGRPREGLRVRGVAVLLRRLGLLDEAIVLLRVLLCLLLRLLKGKLELLLLLLGGGICCSGRRSGGGGITRLALLLLLRQVQLLEG